MYIHYIIIADIGVHKNVRGMAIANSKLMKACIYMALIWELIVQNLGRVTYLPNVVSLFIVAMSDLEVAAKVEMVKLSVLQ